MYVNFFARCYLLLCEWGFFLSVECERFSSFFFADAVTLCDGCEIESPSTCTRTYYTTQINEYKLWNIFKLYFQLPQQKFPAIFWSFTFIWGTHSLTHSLIRSHSFIHSHSLSQSIKPRTSNGNSNIIMIIIIIIITVCSVCFVRVFTVCAIFKRKIYIFSIFCTIWKKKKEKRRVQRCTP